MLEYLHYIPGRLRLKISELRHQRRAAEAEADVLTIWGVKNAVANPVTGSLTIHFDKQTDSICRLWKALQARGYVSTQCPEPTAIGGASKDDPSGDRSPNPLVAAFVQALVQHSAHALVRALL